MRDDFEFNIEFCEEVQLYATLYDYRRSDYCNRSVQDQAWEKISQKFNANVTECKDRWKNIRGSYSKYKAKLQTKSGQGAKRVKEYYLAPHLFFLDPFLKSRKSKGNMDDESDAGEEAETNEHEANNYRAEVTSPDDSILSIGSSHSSLPSPSTSSDIQPLLIKAPEAPVPKGDDFRKRKKLTASATSINDVNHQAYQYFEKKQQMLEMQNTVKKNTAIDPPDPDLAFLHSVLPDMKLMNSTQKRHFKIGILNLSEQILAFTTPEAPTPLMRASQSWNRDSVNTRLNSTLQGNTPEPPTVNVSQSWIQDSVNTSLNSTSQGDTTASREPFNVNEFIRYNN